MLKLLLSIVIELGKLLEVTLKHLWLFALLIDQLAIMLCLLKQLLILFGQFLYLCFIFLSVISQFLLNLQSFQRCLVPQIIHFLDMLWLRYLAIQCSLIITFSLLLIDILAFSPKLTEQLLHLILFVSLGGSYLIHIVMWLLVQLLDVQVLLH